MLVLRSISRKHLFIESSISLQSELKSKETVARYYPGLIILDLVSRAVKENITALGLLQFWYGKFKLDFSPALVLQLFSMHFLYFTWLGLSGQPEPQLYHI